MCNLFGLSALASLALIYLGCTAFNLTISKVFKAGLAKFKATAFWQWLVSKFPSLG